MLNTKINYPYPIIREYVEDYKTTIFTGDLTVNLQPDGYLIRPNFEIQNAGISEYISKGIFTYAIEVQSPATWFRKLYRVKENETIKLNPGLLHERVELIPCIIATEKITDFTNDDFEDDYKGIVFEINIGDVIAIGGKRVFDALYKNDIIKNGSSIVTIAGSEKVTEITCDFSRSVIEIRMPEKQFTDYLECGYQKAKYKTLNAILTIPALVEAICIIASDVKNDEVGEYSSLAWYKTIVVNLKRFAGNDENKYLELLGKPFSSAELLLGNNYEAALKFVNQVN